MSLDMRFHFLLVLEGLVTDCALVAFRSVMLHAMQLQHMIVAKISKANVAVIGLFTGVCSRVDFQLLAACEAFAASFVVALIRFFAGMSSEMDD
jgi:hypothetical protein